MTRVIKLYHIPDTGPGKLTVGKLYGGILIYEIWKTTRFSNLEILAKREQEMAFKIEGVVVGDGKSSTGDRDSVKTVETQQMIDVSDIPSITNIVNNTTTNTMACQPVPEMMDNAMMQEEYDQYNEDPNFNNKQREYYNQRYNIHIIWQLIRKVCTQTLSL